MDSSRHSSDLTLGIVSVNMPSRAIESNIIDTYDSDDTHVKWNSSPHTAPLVPQLNG